MARRRYSFSTADNGTPEINTTTAAKTLLELTAPTTLNVVLTEVKLTMKGTVSSRQPALVELLRATAGLTGGTAITGRPLQAANPIAPNTTGVRGVQTNAANTTEGTVGVLIDSWEIPPTSGFEREFSLEREIEFDTADAAASAVLGLGRRIRLRVTTPDGNELAVARFVIEE